MARKLSSKPDFSKALLRSRPECVVSLKLVEPAPDGNFTYYVQHPFVSGPQPLLGVRSVKRRYIFGDGSTPVPAAVTTCYKIDGHILTNDPITVDFNDSKFSDALTILPSKVPLGEISTDPMLVSAFSIVTAEYEVLAQSCRRDTKIMAKIPQTIREPPYSQVSSKRLRENLISMNEAVDAKFASLGPLDKLSRSDILSTLEVFDAVDKLYINRAGLLHWRLYNLRSNEAVLSPRWEQHWKVLERWNRWEYFEMTFRERYADLIECKEIESSEFVGESLCLGRFCGRIGLVKKVKKGRKRKR